MARLDRRAHGTQAKVVCVGVGVGVGVSRSKRLLFDCLEIIFSAETSTLRQICMQVLVLT